MIAVYLSDLLIQGSGSNDHYPTGTERSESGISTFLGFGGEGGDGAGLWDRGFVGSG